MINLASKIKQYALIFFVSIFTFSCEQKNENHESKVEVDVTTLEKEIEARLKDYQKHLKNGDSVALGNMYMKNAEIIPSTVGRANITKVFGRYIRDSITGSNFKTTQLWGNDQLLVEEGVGKWSHSNGTVVGSGRYLLVWKKDDGEWKILRDTWFPDKEN